MSLFSIFRKKEPTSAAIAKERLQIIVAHGGRRPSSPDFLPQLQKWCESISRSVKIRSISLWIEKMTARSWN